MENNGVPSHALSSVHSSRNDVIVSFCPVCLKSSINDVFLRYRQYAMREEARLRPS
jgi:hypothetical protein